MNRVWREEDERSGQKGPAASVPSGLGEERYFPDLSTAMLADQQYQSKFWRNF
jgi:hypothetical protein